MYYTLHDRTGKYLAIRYSVDGSREFYTVDNFAKAFKTQDIKTFRYFASLASGVEHEWGGGLF